MPAYPPSQKRNALLDSYNGFYERPLASRSSMLPIGTYDNGDGTESAGWAWPQMALDAVEAAEIPGRYLSGDPAQAVTPEDAQRTAINAAGLMMGGGLVAPKPTNSLGVFGGRVAADNLAKQGIHGPKNAIALADRMLADGAKPADIYRSTSDLLADSPYAGVHYGTDGLPRFEIPDNRQIMMSPNGETEFSGGYLFDKGDHRQRLLSRKPYWQFEQMGIDGPNVSHPELAKAYPEMADTKINVDVSNKVKDRGAGVTRGGDIRAFYPYNGYEAPDSWLRSAIAHELDHKAGDIEGFSPGGSPAAMKAHPFYRKERGMEGALNAMIGMPPVEGRLYQRLAGEAQARNTQTRLDMPPSVRRETPPWETMDTPFYDHIEPPNALQSWLNPWLPSGFKIGTKAARELEMGRFATRHETPTPSSVKAYKEPYRDYKAWDMPQRDAVFHPNFPPGVGKFSDEVKTYPTVVLVDGKPATIDSFKSSWIRGGGLEDMTVGKGTSRQYLEDHAYNAQRPDFNPFPEYLEAMRELVDLENAGRLKFISAEEARRAIHPTVPAITDQTLFSSGSKGGAGVGMGMQNEERPWYFDPTIY